MENNIPSSWEEVNIEEILISLESGSRPKGGVKGIVEGIPSIGAEHLNNKGGFDTKNIRYVSETFADKMTKGQIKENDILIVKDGATTGKVSFVNDTFPFPRAVINEHVFICRVFSPINKKFIFYFLWSSKGNKRILDNFQGSAQGGINKGFAINTLIPVSPITEQHRIVEKLDKLFNHLESSKARLEKIPTILKRFRQSVLNAAVTGMLTEDWRKKNPNVEGAEELLKEIKKQRIIRYKKECNQAKELGLKKPSKRYLDEIPDINYGITSEIPNSWTLTNIHFLGHVTKLAGFEYTKYIKFSEIGDIPVVRAQNVQMGKFVESNILYIDQKTSDYLVRSQLHEREILMVFIGAGTGNVCLAPKGKRWHLAPNVAKIDIDGFSVDYINYYLQSPSGLQNTLSFMKATAQPSLSMETIRKIVVQLPPLSEQKEIVLRIKALFKISEKLEQRYKKAKDYIDKLQQSILAKAFRGELVPQDPNDEPASVLLERIKKEKEKLKKKK